MERLKDKVALITGVARPRGIGYGVAKVFTREGAIIAAADISDGVFDRVKELKASGYRAVGFKVDLTKSSEVNKMVREMLDQFGKIDILCNVAGGRPRPSHSFLEMTEKEWDTVIDINLKTAFNCCKAVVPNMVKRRYGKIVNISSVTGPMVTFPASAHYSAAKGGVSGFTRALALDLAQYNITVNAICPGWIDTRDRPMDKTTREKQEQLAQSIPLGRLGEPEEVGDLALFLASDESKYITGTEIVLDGANIIQELKTA